MKNQFLLTFVTPEKEIAFETQVSEVICPGEMGELNILCGHAPLISLLKEGRVSYKEKNLWKRFHIHSGFLEVHPKGVRILSESAIP